MRDNLYGSIFFSSLVVLFFHFCTHLCSQRCAPLIKVFLIVLFVFCRLCSKNYWSACTATTSASYKITYTVLFVELSVCNLLHAKFRSLSETIPLQKLSSLNDFAFLTVDLRFTEEIISSLLLYNLLII